MVKTTGEPDSRNKYAKIVKDIEEFEHRPRGYTSEEKMAAAIKERRKWKICPICGKEVYGEPSYTKHGCPKPSKGWYK